MSSLAEFDRHVDNGTGMMAAGMKMFSDGNREVVGAQEKVVADIKAIFERSTNPTQKRKHLLKNLSYHPGTNVLSDVLL